MTTEKTLLTDILELIDAWEGGIRTGDPDRGVNGDADKELAALAKVRAHIKQLETRCAELERENAEVMLSDQGRLRSKLASYESQIAELRRDRDQWRKWCDTMSGTIWPLLAGQIATGYIGRDTYGYILAKGWADQIDAAIRDSRTGNEESEQTLPR